MIDKKKQILAFRKDSGHINSKRLVGLSMVVLNGDDCNTIQMYEK